MERDGERGRPSRRSIPSSVRVTTTAAPSGSSRGSGGATRVLVVDGSSTIGRLVERAVVDAVGDRVEVARVPVPWPEGRAVLLSRLSEDEIRLWHLVASGRYDTEIASELFVSERTVKRRVAALLRRLGVQRRIEAATLAGRVGLGIEA